MALKKFKIAALSSEPFLHFYHNFQLSMRDKYFKIKCQTGAFDNEDINFVKK